MRIGSPPATVSVIVPNYNHARYLRKRIDSILWQAYQDFELLLLDDCSTDSSREILTTYANNPKVRLEYNAQNSGSVFKQWNKGVRLTGGRYIWIAESDDFSDPEFLARLVPIWRRDRESESRIAGLGVSTRMTNATDMPTPIWSVWTRTIGDLTT